MPWQLMKRAMGLDEGGPLRNVFEQLSHAFGLDGRSATTPPASTVAFTIAVVTLAAKMSKADGVSSAIEAEAFERVFTVPPSELEQVRRVFKLAAQDVAGYESYASQIGRLLADDTDLKVGVLECLFHIASADGVLHPAEDQFLKTVADRLGLTPQKFASVRRAFVHDPDSPYDILGVAPDASDGEIKRHFRDLVRTHHPDALTAKGVPPEFLAAAQRRLATFNAAYDAILIERGKKAEQSLERTP